MKPTTKIRSFRIPEKLYREAQTKADSEGETLAHVVRRALERYVRAGPMVAILMVGVLLLAGCGGSASGSKDNGSRSDTACDMSVKQDGQVDTVKDGPVDAHNTFTLCDTFAKFKAATERYPKAYGDADPAQLVYFRCQNDDVVRTPLCHTAEAKTVPK